MINFKTLVCDLLGIYHNVICNTKVEKFLSILYGKLGTSEAGLHGRVDGTLNLKILDVFLIGNGYLD